MKSLRGLYEKRGYLSTTEVFCAGHAAAFSFFGKVPNQNQERLSFMQPSMASLRSMATAGAVAKLVGIEGGVVSGCFNPNESSVDAPDRRPRHDEHYHEARCRSA